MQTTNSATPLAGELTVELTAGVAETTFPAPSRVQFVDFRPYHPTHRRNHELSNSLAPLHRIGEFAEIHHDDLDLAPIIGIDCPGRIGQRDAVA